MGEAVPDVCHRRFPRPPLPVRRHGLAPQPPPAPVRRPTAARAHRSSLALREPVMYARRKGCGQPCLYPDFVYGGGRGW